MGHVRLGILPRTRRWVELIALLEDRADVDVVARQALLAVSRVLASAGKEEEIVHTFWLLTQIPLAAKRPDFQKAFEELGISVSSSPSIIEITAGLVSAIDGHSDRWGPRSDITEIAVLSAAESITALAGPTTVSLFGSPPEETLRRVASLSAQRQFGLLTREFVGRFLNRFLAYHLSRETSNHVGPHQAFESVREHTEFFDALKLHCRQASLIVQDYAGGWFSKAEYEGGITHDRAARFVAHSFSKVKSELQSGAKA